jgi:hypothetical protein
MGTLKELNYKHIKNFLTKNEVQLFSTYCEIKHRSNLNNFDSHPISHNRDTYFYGDTIMDSLLLLKQKFIEEAVGEKLLPTYSYWRMYTKYATLDKHTDRPSCEVSVTTNLGNCGVDWPILMGDKEVNILPGDAVIYFGPKIEHGRDEFLGDWAAQCFLHYVYKDGPYKDLHMDGRKFWGIERK